MQPIIKITALYFPTTAWHLLYSILDTLWHKYAYSTDFRFNFLMHKPTNEQYIHTFYDSESIT